MWGNPSSQSPHITDSENSSMFSAACVTNASHVSRILQIRVYKVTHENTAMESVLRLALSSSAVCDDCFVRYVARILTHAWKRRSGVLETDFGELLILLKVCYVPAYAYSLPFIESVKSPHSTDSEKPSISFVASRLFVINASYVSRILMHENTAIEFLGLTLCSS